MAVAVTRFTAQRLQQDPYFIPGSGKPGSGIPGVANCSACSGISSNCVASYADMVQCTNTGNNCDNIFPCPGPPASGSAGGTLNALTSSNNPPYTIPGGLWNIQQTNCGIFGTSYQNQCSNVDPGLCPVPSGAPIPIDNIPNYSLPIPANPGNFYSPGVQDGVPVLNTFFINAPTSSVGLPSGPATIGCDYEVTWFQSVRDLTDFTNTFSSVDPNYNLNYGSILTNLCTQVYTPVPGSTTNLCPTDPLTNQPMPQCSYFLADDPGGIGVQCRNWISASTSNCPSQTNTLVNAAMNQFCTNPTTENFPECLCINRQSNPVYKQATNNATSQENDYCWWTPCKDFNSPFYLTPTLPGCAVTGCANICEIVVDNYKNNTNGNSQTDINSYINCPGISNGGTPSPNPNPPDDTNWVLIIGIAIISVIVIIVLLSLITKSSSSKKTSNSSNL